MKHILKHIIIASIALPALATAQGVNSLALEQYYQMVHSSHPIAKQAELFSQRGDMALREARGSFDPKLVSDYSRKEFEGKNYYDVWDSYVKIPTLLNMDFKAGYERNQGLFLNPERNVPNDGLYYAGISLPIGQGLIHNQRNINLKKGNFERKNFENEATIVLNNLFLDANYAYWWWFENFQKKQIVSNNLELINERFQGIKESIINGDKASIDSVEMLIQVQQWTNDLSKAELELQNSLLLLKNFIWNDSIDASSIIPTEAIPQSDAELNKYLNWAITDHPELKKLSIKGNVLELDRRMSAEQLKPIIDLNYNILLSEENQDVQASSFSNNYKLGARFVFPLLIRKERAKLRSVKLKQQENELKTNQKYREVVNKIQQSYNKVFTLGQMITRQNEMLINYTRMLEAEQSKFDNGESSIFLLNSRANKKLQGEIKLIEMKSKYHMAIGELKWSAGTLYDDIKTLKE